METVTTKTTYLMRNETSVTESMSYSPGVDRSSGNDDMMVAAYLCATKIFIHCIECELLGYG